MGCALNENIYLYLEFGVLKIRIMMDNQHTQLNYNYEFSIKSLEI